MDKCVTKCNVFTLYMIIKLLKNEIRIHAKSWMKSEDIILIEMCHKLKFTYCNI